MERKYEFTGETTEFEGRILHRVRYLRYLNKMVDEGIVGGWIESEENLSHGGDCYVLNEAKIFGDARVIGNSRIIDYAIVKDNVKINGNNIISHHSVIGADTIMDGACIVSDQSKIFFYADEQYGNPNLLGDSFIGGTTVIEATGYIQESYVKDQSLDGCLQLFQASLG